MGYTVNMRPVDEILRTYFETLPLGSKVILEYDDVPTSVVWDGNLEGTILEGVLSVRSGNDFLRIGLETFRWESKDESGMPCALRWLPENWYGEDPFWTFEGKPTEHMRHVANRLEDLN